MVPNKCSHSNNIERGKSTKLNDKSQCNQVDNPQNQPNLTYGPIVRSKNHQRLTIIGHLEGHQNLTTSIGNCQEVQRIMESTTTSINKDKINSSSTRNKIEELTTTNKSNGSMVKTTIAHKNERIRNKETIPYYQRNKYVYTDTIWKSDTIHQYSTMRTTVVLES